MKVRVAREAGNRLAVEEPVRDQDQDTVEDAVDNCPTEKGVPENAGCAAKKRQLVIVTADKLQIMEKVFSPPARARCWRSPSPLLDNCVANVLVSHPDLQVRIEGHRLDWRAGEETSRSRRAARTR